MPVSLFPSATYCVIINRFLQDSFKNIIIQTLNALLVLVLPQCCKGRRVSQIKIQTDLYNVIPPSRE